jgi:hypothetical protein
MLPFEQLKIIDQVIREHQQIRSNIKLVGETVNDMEAVFGLQQAYSSWTQSTAVELKQKLDVMTRVLGTLLSGVAAHFTFEQERFPLLLGETVSHAIELEHEDIQKKAKLVSSSFAALDLDTLDKTTILTKKVQLQTNVGELTQMLQEHAHREDVIIGMVKKSLEESV